jgi:hypothetical protein
MRTSTIGGAEDSISISSDSESSDSCRLWLAEATAPGRELLWCVLDIENTDVDFKDWPWLWIGSRSLMGGICRLCPFSDIMEGSTVLVS